MAVYSQTLNKRLFHFILHRKRIITHQVILHFLFALKHYEEKQFPFLEVKFLLRVFFLRTLRANTH